MNDLKVGAFLRSASLRWNLWLEHFYSFREEETSSEKVLHNRDERGELFLTRHLIK